MLRGSLTIAVMGAGNGFARSFRLRETTSLRRRKNDASIKNYVGMVTNTQQI
jgi:hypothetical protein